METNKNSMLPTYQGNYRDMLGALKAGVINSPVWFFCEDRNALAFIHWEKDENGEKKLVPHLMLWDKIEVLDEKVEEVSKQMEGLTDPTTGEPIKVVEYVTETVAPVEEKVQIVNEAVQDIRKNGATIMITVPEDGGGE